MSDGAGSDALLTECLDLVQPQPRRGDVQFWAVLAALPCLLLGARFGLDLGPLPALGAATAAWLPVLLLWWNRHAEREHARIEQALERFDAAFPVKGVGRPQALAALARIAGERGHARHHAAHLLLAELEAGGTPQLATGRAARAVAPDMEYRGPGAFTSASTPSPAAPGEEPLLPPELQAKSGEPGLETPDPAPDPRPRPTPEPEEAAPGEAPEQDTFDYIPLDPHDPGRR